MSPPASTHEHDLPESAEATGFDLELFYDGDCPLCTREVAWLRRLDHGQRIRFVDIAASDFDAAALGVSWQTLMARIHARLPNGTLIEGVEVFRRAYTAVGLSPLAALSRLPGISQALDAGYTWFAKNRLSWTGRCADGACQAPARR